MLTYRPSRLASLKDWLLIRYEFSKEQVSAKSLNIPLVKRRLDTVSTVDFDKLSRVFPENIRKKFLIWELGDVVFGEGSHSPVRWSNIRNPAKVADYLDQIRRTGKFPDSGVGQQALVGETEVQKTPWHKNATLGNSSYGIPAISKDVYDGLCAMSRRTREPFLKWHVQEGDYVSRGDIIASYDVSPFRASHFQDGWIDTKADICAPADGKILRISSIEYFDYVGYSYPDKTIGSEWPDEALLFEILPREGRYAGGGFETYHKITDYAYFSRGQNSCFADNPGFFTRLAWKRNGIEMGFRHPFTESEIELVCHMKSREFQKFESEQGVAPQSTTRSVV